MGGQLDAAGTAARRALAAPRLSVQAETYAAWALAAVEALTGHGDRVAALVARATTAARQAPETAAHQVNIRLATWVWKCAFSPDGTLLATVSNDQTRRLWQIANGRCHSASD